MTTRSEDRRLNESSSAPGASKTRTVPGPRPKDTFSTFSTKVCHAATGFAQTTRTFAEGVVGILKDPDTYAMVALGALVSGRTGCAAISLAGFRGLWAGRAGLAIRASLGLRTSAVARAAVAAAIDGATFHTGMNLYHELRGHHDRATWDWTGYLRSIVSFQALEGVRALHLARPIPLHGYGLLHGARRVFDELAAISVIGVGEALLRDGDFKTARLVLRENLQFLVAMRVVGLGRSALGGKHKDHAATLRSLELAAARTERKASRAFRQGKKKEAYVLFREAYVLQRRHALLLETFAERLRDEGLVRERDPAYSGEPGVIRRRSPDELAAMVRAIRDIRLESAGCASEISAVEQWYQGVLAGNGFTDPLTGRIEMLKDADLGCVRHHGSHRLVHGLAAEKRQRLMEVFEALDPADRRAMVESPNFPDYLKCADAFLQVDELLARWNAHEDPSSCRDPWTQALHRCFAPVARQLGLDLHGLDTDVLDAMISRPYRNRGRTHSLIG
ncbi:MAG: hypothetical protein IPK13_23800 [Deltaproteobacteria bacterium]|nr:hypothetical protein [Deltaproteobacteria bacterium]